LVKYSNSLTNFSRFVRENPRLIHFVLPIDAIEGLKNALADCSRLPRQLQYEADQVSDLVYLIHFFILFSCSLESLRNLFHRLQTLSLNRYSYRKLL
uniref:Uncharacterized protein n=1 Tax=Parascaris equorum TaxID=6256 RepID=A0A914RIL2_PAREQ